MADTQSISITHCERLLLLNEKVFYVPHAAKRDAMVVLVADWLCNPKSVSLLLLLLFLRVKRLLALAWDLNSSSMSGNS